MRLTINEEDVDYSLENERTLGEVVHGVRAWLAAAGFVISGLSADGRDLLQAPADTWGATGVDTVGTVAIQTTHTGDLRIAHWRAVEAWLSLLDDEVNRGPDPVAPDPLGELLEGLPQTIDAFSANSFLPPGSDAAGRFRSLFGGATPAAVRAWPPETRQAASRVVGELRSFLRARIEDAVHPEQAAARLSEGLRASMEELKEVSVLLQTGRDRPAMEAVIRFTDVTQSIMDLLPFLAPEPERARLFSELTAVLKELVGAFDSRDSVLIGDLLEYEVAPRLEKLAPLLGRTL